MITKKIPKEVTIHSEVLKGFVHATVTPVYDIDEEFGFIKAAKLLGLSIQGEVYVNEKEILDRLEEIPVMQSPLGSAFSVTSFAHKNRGVSIEFVVNKTIKPSKIETIDTYGVKPISYYSNLELRSIMSSQAKDPHPFSRKLLKRS